jgi:hypothetical protein
MAFFVAEEYNLKNEKATRMQDYRASPIGNVS